MQAGSFQKLWECRNCYLVRSLRSDLSHINLSAVEAPQTAQEVCYNVRASCRGTDCLKMACRVGHAAAKAGYLVFKNV